QIKTYAGVGLDDAAASVRLDLTPQGFHAQVLTSGGRSFYIDPARAGDPNHYLSFFRRDMNRAAAGPLRPCGFAPTPAARKVLAARLHTAGRPAAALASGAQLRTYRLALANTPEYAQTKGNTLAGVMAAEATTINRVVGVYEKELAVRLVLIANNNLLLFLNATGQRPPVPYDNNDGAAMLGQNQSNVDQLIGTAGYDIGHVFSTGGGGIASLASVCDPTQKAQGVTGSPNPVGDAFDIDYVAHEMGHQFGGNHPFNGEGSNCGGGNRNASTAFEPGSGSTIMAYAGICGSADDLQANSDPYFHTGNYEEMQSFIATLTCGTTAATGNTAPVVTAPAGGKTLPIGTPFKLTATATDAQGDPLTYSWEELDLGPAGSPNSPQVTSQSVPLFRSFIPSASGTRYFPRLSNLVNNTTVIGERLPTVSRALTFRCTARDQHSGTVGVIGGVDYSALVRLTVNAVAGPFVVTAPNTAVSWVGGAAQTVTWNVANTSSAPVSCATVNIRLSLDGGLTYPTTLATGVPNNGAAVVVAPSPTSNQTQARIMVEAADNYFFDISNANFTISTPAPGPTITSFTPTGGLAGTVVTVLGSNFTGATQVAFNGTAATIFSVSSATQLTATVPAGATTGPIRVTAPSGVGTSGLAFTVAPPPTIVSFAPTSGYVGSVVTLTGTNFTGASQVTFNGVAAISFTVNSATQITATVPASATTGPVGVTTAVSTATSATSFTVVPAPVVASFTPARSAPGGLVVITGSYFTGSTQVLFNGVAATFTVNSATQITATVPVGATTGPIAITSPAGTGTSATNFEVPPANDLCANAITLSCGQAIAGTTLLATATGDPTGTCTESIDGGGVFYAITGTGSDITLSTCDAATDFDTKLFVYSGSCGSYVCVDGNDDASTCNANSTASEVTFTSVAGQPYLVFVGGFGNAAGQFLLTATCVNQPAPVIAALLPASGPVGTVVTLTGTNLTGATSLMVNGVRASGLVVSSGSSLRFTVPVGATTGPVVVSTTGGNSNGVTFTVTSGLATAQALQTEFSVWPNPVAGHGTLHVSLATATSAAQATLRNVLGQLVATRAFGGAGTELPTAGLAAGTYLLTVQAAGRAPSVQRVVVE
ncbi:MAG: M12 family metallo-peptidase, partial [Bacteroidota bacterium]|nr:M12 family metallo-peptidase [Bacteroidota bacterium]